jgi:hypothetical protein
MKNLFFFVLTIVFALNAKISNCQLVTPSQAACPGITVIYIINPSYYGNREFHVVNGVFIENANLYCPANDSTNICKQFSSTINTIKIRWNNTSHSGTLRLKQATTWIDQDFVVGIIEAPRFAPGEGDKQVLNGTSTFQVQLLAHKNLNYYSDYSNNITLTNQNKKQLLGDDYLWTFTYQISGDQSGWVKFRTKNIYCTVYSDWATINIYRKLNAPILTGSYTICGTYENYSIVPDSKSQTHTWTVLSGLKILISGNQLTTYTGPETTVTILNSTSGTPTKSSIKVKSDAVNYVSSNEVVKEVRINGPVSEDFSFYVCKSTGEVANNYSGNWVLCPNTTYHITLNDNGPCSTSNYTWNVPSGWTMYYTMSNMISINTNSSPGGPISVSGYTCCNTNQMLLQSYMGTDYSCGGYYLVISPNPADDYIQVQFNEIENEEVTEIAETKSKIKINKELYTDKESIDYSVKIINRDGEILKNIESNKLDLNIPINDILPGYYFVHIKLNGETYKQQLIIY